MLYWLSDILDIRYIRGLENYKVELTEQVLRSEQICFFGDANQVQKLHFNHNLWQYKKIFNNLAVNIQLKRQIKKFFDENDFHNVLGIHYRTGDISDPDNPRHHDRFIAPDEMLYLVSENQQFKSFNNIYIMQENDSLGNEFFEKIKNKFKHKNIFKFEKKNLIQMGRLDSIHGDSQSVKEAFIEMLILSKCKYVLRSRARGALSALACQIGDIKKHDIT